MNPINRWTIRQLAAQCIFPRIETEKYFSDSDYKKEQINLVKEGIGGFCVFTGTMASVLSMTDELQSNSEISLLFCADFEHGLPMRLEDGTPFPHAWAMAKGANTEQIATAIAGEAKNIGISLNLAPVADINSNRNNPIINIRAFGENLEDVEENVSSYIKGLKLGSVAGCAKHFPGHGDTSVDSHIELPTIISSLKELSDLHLKPFIKAIDADVESIMLGHILVPALDVEFPCSISKKAVSYIRDDLSYSGLLITDALDMKGLKGFYQEYELPFRALEAGADIALIPANPFEALEFIERNIDKSQDLLDNLNKSCSRIINLKKNLKLFNYHNKLDKMDDFNIPNEKLALNAAYNAIDLMGDKNLIPIDEKRIVAGFAIIQGEDLSAGASFFNLLAQAIPNDCEFGFIDSNMEEVDLNSIKNGIDDCDMIIIASFFRPQAYCGSVNPDLSLKEIVKNFGFDKDILIISFGNPYLNDFFDYDLYMNTFSDSYSSIAAAVMKLSGRNPIIMNN
ncbi:MAG: hypothetical protein NT007_11385 [Candidatus Kapabacteria bacterium]|nr:hypothetical protein [Candidatus Kapabacteria bacterium]